MPTRLIMRGGGEIVGIVGWLDDIQEAIDRARNAGEAWVSLEREPPAEGSAGYRLRETVRVRADDVVAVSGLREGDVASSEFSDNSLG